MDEDQFRVGFPQELRGLNAPRERGRRATSAAGMSVFEQALARQLAALFARGCDRARLCGRRLTLRHIAIYLSHISLGLSQKAVARLFGRDRTTVRYVCARIEDLRDHRPIDRMLAALEAAILAFQAAFGSPISGERP